LKSYLYPSLGALLVAVQAASPSQGAQPKPTRETPSQAAETSAEREYLKLLEADNAAQEEVDRWIRDNNAFRAQGAGVDDTTIGLRVEKRLEPVKQAYEDFLKRHPKHVEARLAFGSFLNDIRLEQEAVEQWEKARKLDPGNPASWNNLANHYGHRGPVKKAFDYYAKAIEINPKEPVYYQNMATTVFLFRKDACEHYAITEQEVFDKALALYRKALALAPNDFLLAQDVAQTYYGIKPPRHAEAIVAWERALKVAGDDVQREGVQLHLARVKSLSGNHEAARQHLNLVSNVHYTELKGRLARSIANREKGATNLASDAEGSLGRPDRVQPAPN
jgi:tetratricopeptide (TPR) repeat protein